MGILGVEPRPTRYKQAALTIKLYSQKAVSGYLSCLFALVWAKGRCGDALWAQAMSRSRRLPCHGTSHRSRGAVVSLGVSVGAAVGGGEPGRIKPLGPTYYGSMSWASRGGPGGLGGALGLRDGAMAISPSLVRIPAAARRALSRGAIGSIWSVNAAQSAPWPIVSPSMLCPISIGRNW